MKRKGAFILVGSLFLVVVVLAVIVLAPLLRTYVAQIRSGRLPFVPVNLPVTNATGPTDGYGIYESCSPKTSASSDCLAHLDSMAAAGFKLVINYGEIYGDASFQKAYLDRAQSVGMKVIFPLKAPAFYEGKDLRSTYPDLAKTCNCTDNSGFLAYVVKLVKDHPALWGYYIGDEVEPENHDALKTKLSDVVHQLDPVHPRLFIDSSGRTVATWHGNSPFYDTADVIGTDFYPIRDYSPSYPALDRAGEVAAGVQAYADAHKHGGAIVLQAFSYSNYDIPGTSYPTTDQMKYMLSETLLHSRPQIIFWYSYYDTMSSGNDSDQHWNALKSLIARHA
ncbi:hypothetical protein KSF_060760 [Reticulibacter mediterranei]|uniref:Uncharacterized protein n=1 Tax=Reticulibacter mediterranei TaxID=2778369 RepID=A0A8J3IP87_9CHLR|nr:hypothetical protein [Reticulibacter mediterranei]GHO96028.1 hypothetical protein KSF_060760 [Reticulibacter mediterranei]